jgi:hypothetical protein
MKQTNKQTNKQTDRQNIMILYNLIYVDFQSSIRLLKMSVSVLLGKK